MKDKLEKLEELKSLQDYENSINLKIRVEELEKNVELLNSIVEDLVFTLKQLQMDFHRDHTKLINSDTV